MPQPLSLPDHALRESPRVGPKLKTATNRYPSQFFRSRAVSLALAALFCHQCPSDARAADASAKRPRPNVLFLLTDDQRADTIHALGNAVIQTPNLDRLARSGLVFRNA